MMMVTMTPKASKTQSGKHYVSKEVSWLSFNARVLQEAADPQVPLGERITYLGIYSNNLDEFFRVRVATLQRLLKIRKKATLLIGRDPQEVLDQVQRIVLQQGEEFDRLYAQILQELATHGVHIRQDTELSADQAAFVQDYIQTDLRPQLVPLLLGPKTSPNLRDHQIYLAIVMKRTLRGEPDHALIQIPTDRLPRFLTLPSPPGETHIILLDDVIRAALPQIFAYSRYKHFAAYTIKLTRDSELDIDDELFKSFPQKVQDSLTRRKTGAPTRFVYDRAMPKALLGLFQKLLKITQEDTFIPGGRYHNFKDFMRFPRLPDPNLYFPPKAPTPHPLIRAHRSLFTLMSSQDLLLHFPYQPFVHFVDLLREAAIDPQVESIRLTVYRLAPQSSIINALVSAAQNGKKVFVVMELQARFDEAANLQWSAFLREDGVRVVHGVPGLKVHAKLCLITRREGTRRVRYAALGTGNFNENTARLYTDHLLFTADKLLTTEVHRVFEFFENTYRLPAFRQLIVSPFNSRAKFRRLIRNEIAAARKGREAWIDIKINNLSDPEMVHLLYEASAAGVRIRIIARSMLSLIPELKNVSAHIEAISLVGQLLEHSRFFIFANGGTPLTYLSSADWLPRNFDRRVEVSFPLLDPALQAELRRYFDLQWADNVKARLWTRDLDNPYRTCPEGAVRIDAQQALQQLFAAPDPSDEVPP